MTSAPFDAPYDLSLGCVRPHEAPTITGMSVRHMKRKAADPEDDFPPLIPLSERVSVWPRAELFKWLARRIERAPVRTEPPKLVRAKTERARRPGATPSEESPANLAPALAQRAAGTGSTGRRRGRPPKQHP